MKKIKFLVILFFMVNIVFSQKDYNYVVYKAERYNKNKKLKKSKYNSVNVLIKKMLVASEKIRFELLFDEQKSIFNIQEMIIPKEEQNVYQMASLGVGVPQGNFRVKTKKLKYKITESYGERFKVIYPYNQYKWNITKETKTILGYKCYKATSTWEEYDSGRDLNLTFSPVVWFTYDLPYPYGPKGFDGLPGLVLEGSFNGVTYFKAIQIEKKEDLKFPKIPKAKEISFTDFLKFIGENFKRIRGGR